MCGALHSPSHFKPKRWVTCHQPRTLEDTVLLMEAYMLAEAGIYLKKNLQQQAIREEQAKKFHQTPETTGAPRRDGPLGEPPALPTPIFNKPRPKGLTGRGFGCGQPGHYRADCPHMDCTWVKSLCGTQVGPTLLGGRLGRFMIPVALNGEQVEALIDTGCGRTLVRKARGPFNPEWLRLQCIHGDIRE